MFLEDHIREIHGLAQCQCTETIVLGAPVSGGESCSSCRRHIFTSQHGKFTSLKVNILLTGAFLAYQQQAHCREIHSTRSLVTYYLTLIESHRSPMAELALVKCISNAPTLLVIVIQRLPVSVERRPTLSCWVQLPLLLRGMVTSTLARSRVMAGVTSITLARPSCISTAATSAFWLGSHACSKGSAPLGWLHHRMVALLTSVSIKTSRFFDSLKQNKQMLFNLKEQSVRNWFKVMIKWPWHVNRH